LEPARKLGELVLDERPAARRVAALHERVGQRTLRLEEVELGRKPRIGARLGDVEGVAAYPDRVVQNGDLRIQRAKREVGLGNAAGEGDIHHVAREPVREQARPRRLVPSSDAAPEIDLVTGRQEGLVTGANGRDAGGYRRLRERADADAGIAGR